jgi:hypothetical protein
MSVEDGSRVPVVVGPTRVAAARAFGKAFDDLLVTTYADLAADFDAESHRLVGLVSRPEGATTDRAVDLRALTEEQVEQVLEGLLSQVSDDRLGGTPDLRRLVAGLEAVPQGADEDVVAGFARAALALRPSQEDAAASLYGTRSSRAPLVNRLGGILRRGRG